MFNHRGTEKHFMENSYGGILYRQNYFLRKTQRYNKLSSEKMQVTKQLKNVIKILLQGLFNQVFHLLLLIMLFSQHIHICDYMVRN